MVAVAVGVAGVVVAVGVTVGVAGVVVAVVDDSVPPFIPTEK